MSEVSSMKFKAYLEVNETSESLNNGIKQLRELIEGERNLECPQDEQFLLRFLRARKFNVGLAFLLLKRYYIVRAFNPQLFANAYPSLYLNTLSMGAQAVLHQRDENGSRIYIFRLDKFDMSRVTVEDIFKTNLMALEYLSREVETQISGIVVIVDVKGFTMKHHYKLLSPQIAKQSIDLIQDAFPIRFRAFHVINEPLYFNAIFAALKLFIKTKLSKRIHFHGSNMASLHQHINGKLLPFEYGDGELFDSVSFQWKNRLLSEENIFKDMSKFGFKDENTLKIHYNSSL